MSRAAGAVAPGRRAPILVLIAVLALVAGVRLRLADAPLERDEGEYAYAGQLIRDGIPPYRLVYNMKLPGTYYAYAAAMSVFGEHPRGVRYGLLVVNLATALLVWVLGRRLFCAASSPQAPERWRSEGAAGAAVAAAAFALLSLDRGIMGPFGHATHFVLLPALGGLLLVLDAGAATPPAARRAKVWAKTLAAGALLGSAVLMKQHAVFFLVLGAALAIGAAPSSAGAARAAAARVLLLGAGALLPLLVVVAVLWAQGAGARFWFWTVRYAAEYVSQVPLARAPALFLAGARTVFAAAWPLWLLGLLGLAALWLPRGAARLGRRERAVLNGLLAAGVLALVPGFFFRAHYFIVLLPAVALGCGAAALAAERAAARRLLPAAARAAALAPFVLAAATYLVAERGFLFSWSGRELVERRYGYNPFTEAAVVAGYLRQRTKPGESIAVLGSEPEIYFYADRPSATGFIYTYSLLEPQPHARGMQAEMIAEIEAAKPRYLVMVDVGTSWLPQPTSDLGILDWAARHTERCYDLVGFAQVERGRPSIYRLAQRPLTERPRAGGALLVFRRRGGPGGGAAAGTC